MQISQAQVTTDRIQSEPMEVEHPIERSKRRPSNLHVGRLRSLARLERTGVTTPTGASED